MLLRKINFRVKKSAVDKLIRRSKSLERLKREADSLESLEIFSDHRLKMVLI